MFPGVGLFGFIMRETLWLPRHVYLFSHQVREVFSHCFFKQLSIPCSLSSPSGNPVMRMFYTLCCPKGPLNYYFLEFFFTFCSLLLFFTLIGCLLLPCLKNRWFSPLLHPTYYLFSLVSSSFQILSSSFLISSFLLFLCPLLYLLYLGPVKGRFCTGWVCEGKTPHPGAIWLSLPQIFPWPSGKPALRRVGSPSWGQVQCIRLEDRCGALPLPPSAQLSLWHWGLHTSGPECWLLWRV